MKITVSSPINETPRVLQIRGMFDLPEEKTSTVSWKVSLPLHEREWLIGLVVGPSGCGKSTISRSLWPKALTPQSYTWSPSESILDAFPAPEDGTLGIKDVVAVLSSVGFSSPPAWLRPYHVLSTGQQFRVTMARLICDAITNQSGSLPGKAKKELAQHHAPIVVDEFTSVVDRTVAKIGSCAVAKTLRAHKTPFVAVTCHEDVEEWLQPDWVYRPHLGEDGFAWRSLCRRPKITLQVIRCFNDAWPLFAPHHYLNTTLNRGSVSFLATWEGRPVCFSSWIAWFGAGPRTKREHRTVTLPDYQGVGIGNAVSTLLASMWKSLGFRATSTTTHPAMIQSRLRNDAWKMVRSPSFLGTNDIIEHSSNRLTAGFEYIGPPMPVGEAKALHAA